MTELVLGCAQLGLAYGIANTAGQPSRGEAVELLRRAADSGIAQFDTARAYGDSEARLGEALGGRDVTIITKLSPLAGLAAAPAGDDVRAAVDASIEHSLAALGRDRLDCLLLHRAAHLAAYGGAVWRRLLALRAEGRADRLGVSVQSPREALAALAEPDVRHVQLPFNPLDWRWREAGVAAACERRPDVTVHARSVFLQGLLAAGDASIWPPIPGVDAETVVRSLARLARELDRESPADLCLAYAGGHAFIDGVVVGLETAEQLELNLRLAAKPPLAPDDCRFVEQRLPRLPEQLLDPSRWPQR